MQSLNVYMYNKIGKNAPHLLHDCTVYTFAAHAEFSV